MDVVAVDVFVLLRNTSEATLDRDAVCHTTRTPMERARAILTSNFGFKEFRLSQAQVRMYEMYGHQ